MAELITDAYREMQRKLHENPDYGVASLQYASLVAQFLEQARATELLDYGAGKGRLGEALRPLVKWPLDIAHYEPSRPEWAATPEPSEFVTCIDVLEHIEPDLLQNVLDDLRRLTTRQGFFTVHCGPAVKILPDGRNAHLTQQPPRWWLQHFIDRFDIVQMQKVPNGFWILVQKL
jgi:hypothetical protein